jgi:protease II
VVAAREGVQYSVTDRGGELFILTNADDAIDFKIVTAPLASPERANWRDLIPHRAGIYILDIELYSGHLVRLERANALPAIIIRDLKTSEEHAIAFDEAAYSLDTMGGYEFDTTNLRFAYSSMTTPSEVYDYDMATRTRTFRKRQEIPSGHNPADYVTTRIMATSHDGALVPVSILHGELVATEARRCCLRLPAHAWRCRPHSPPTGCRWSIAASSTRSRISAAAPTRAGAGISTANARRSRTRSMISQRLGAR